MTRTIESIMVHVPKRHRTSTIDTGDKELDSKISDLNRRLYYLKKYGLEIVPNKRDYNKKTADYHKTKIEKYKCTVFFD